MARTKLNFGFSAGDGKGFILQEGAKHIEDALDEVYMFLSGGQSGVKLPVSLPKSRGGTGGVGDKGAKEYVAFQGVKTFQPLLVKHVPVAYCTVGLGMDPKTTNVVELTSEIMFYRTGVGTYKCTVFDNIKINGDYIYAQPDNFGNQSICGVPTYAGNEITIAIHPVVFNQTSRKFEADTSKRIDVPSDTFISFVLVNTLGTFV